MRFDLTRGKNYETDEHGSFGPSQPRGRRGGERGEGRNVGRLLEDVDDAQPGVVAGVGVGGRRDDIERGAGAA